MTSIVTSLPAQTPLLTRDAIEELCKESQFWVVASELMLDHGLWKLVE